MVKGAYSKCKDTNENFIHLRLQFPSNDQKKSNEEVIIMAGGFLTSLLENSELGFFDGTFKVAPSSYTQLMTLMVLNPVTNLFTPIVYFFATAKTEEIYYYAFSGLKSFLFKMKVQLKIKIIIVDFELAIHNAWKAIFPDISLIGCFFHLVFIFKL